MIRINLLPVEDRVREDDPKGRIWAIVGLGAVAGVALLIMFTYGLQGHTLGGLSEEAATLEMLAAKYKPLIQRVNEISQERRDIEAKIAVIQDLDAERNFRVRLLEELNRFMPRYAWLTKFVETGGASAEIQGKSFSNLTVSDFIANLEDSDLYDGVDLSVTKKAEVGEREVFEFRMTAALTKAPPDSGGLSTATEH